MNCKCCGAWFSSSDASQELCAGCRRALERVSPIIESLSAELEQVKRERDAAVEDLKYAGSMDGEFCSICKYQPEAECEKRNCECIDCFEWRGVKDD